ncbi:hypothetical protein BELL_1167g00010 [Botrytis elliptica]|uniref:DUF3500 domain-containing protein n=1 Tax=Botrytis elliptica TaxID=278938 RepID=A0A4Z1II47_9HELO|nr:hypothetical protein EAE99_006047 [Botrytis elliptica]TGO61251.1 hypothetical protein BELL_1167g00010 [Botrytis elliptica]
MLFGLSLFALCTLVQSLPSKSHAVRQVDDGTTQSMAIVDAANTLLGLLTAEQNASLVYPYEAAGNATPVYFGSATTGGIAGEQFGQSVWTNYPVGIVDRVGLARDNFTDTQEEAVLNLLRVMFSEDGYNKVQEIMNADQVEEDRGVDYEAGLGSYTLGFFGEPSLTSLWMIQFGGHHLGINMAMYGSKAVIAPLLTGCLPAINNVTKRVLAAENDIAFSLVGSLDDSLFAQANITHDVSTLTLGPGHDGEEYITEGVSVSLFTEAQQALVVDLVSEWAGLLNPVHYAPRLAEIKAGLNETYFAWSGPTTKEDNQNGESYFRIKGPNLWVEYAPQTNDEYGDLRLHAHTIYRDQLRGYGRTLEE